MSNSASLSANQQQLWGTDLWADIMDDLYFTKNGMMGSDPNNIIYLMDDLMEKKGKSITVSLTAKKKDNGANGDSELEGNEGLIVASSEDILIDQKRFAWRATGLLDEQRNAYNMRLDAKEKLKIQMTEWLERQFFLKLAGVNNTTITDVDGETVGTDCTWSNTPDVIPAADEANSGTKYRYVNAAGATLASAFTTTLMTPSLISKMRIKASMAKPKVLPLRVNGKPYYILFIHPWQANDLKNNAVYAQAAREAEVRGKDNPLFTGALMVWDGVIVHEHPYVPFLDVSVALHSFAGPATGTDIATDCFRAILCGQKAGVFAKCKSPNQWVEKKFDYDNQTGFSTSMIGGIQKIVFANYGGTSTKDLEYGVVCSDTAATAL